MRYAIAALALTLAACAPDATAPTVALSHPAYARHPKPAAADAPLSIAPVAMTIAVGETVTFTSSYAVAKPAEFVNFFWGCQPDPECWSTVFVLPNFETANTTASITGLAPGTVQVYVADGLGLSASATVVVQ